MLKQEDVFRKANRLLLPEAGGGAARSAYLLLPRWARKKVVAIDCNPLVGIEWRQLNPMLRAFVLEDDINIEDGDVILPSDNYFRIKRDIKSAVTDKTPFDTHHKVRSMERLEAYIASNDAVVRVQKRVHAVSRESMSSGGVGTRIHGTTDDVLVTEYIPFTDELVVDFFKGEELIVFPRISHRRSHGYDVMVTLLGEKHPVYSFVRQATQDVVEGLNLHGVGHVQLGMNEDGLWFIEAAERLSGTAWINQESSGNPLMGVPSRKFGHLYLSVWGVLHDL